MANVHQSFTTELHTKPYEQGLSRMEQKTKESTSRVSREFSRVESGLTRGGSSRNNMRAGQVAMQMQDIGVQMQMGVRASTIIAQQGSQLLSIFGPGGAIAGGLLTIGALIWSSVSASKEAAAAAEKEAAERKKVESARAREAAWTDIDKNIRATQLATIEAEQGKEAAKAAERQMIFEDKISAIREARDKGLLIPETANLQAGMVIAARDAQERAELKAKMRQQREGKMEDFDKEIGDRAAQIRGRAPSKAEARREEREEERARRRAIRERQDKADRARRNDLEGTNRTREMTPKERAEQLAEAQRAMRAAKDDKFKTELSDEALIKIVNAIGGLIAK